MKVDMPARTINKSNHILKFERNGEGHFPIFISSGEVTHEKKNEREEEKYQYCKHNRSIQSYPSIRLGSIYIRLCLFCIEFCGATTILYIGVLHGIIKFCSHPQDRTSKVEGPKDRSKTFTKRAETFKVTFRHTNTQKPIHEFLGVVVNCKIVFVIRFVG